jgi:flagellar motor switch protein FliG
VSKKIVSNMANEFVEMNVSEDSSGVIKQTVANVYMWATSGKSSTEIAKFLTLSKKEWEELTRKYPEVLGAFIKGKEFANTLLSMSMYEMAVGKQTVRRQILNKDGEAVWLEEEIPPNVRFNALKFLLENQVPQTYGKNIAKQDQNDYAKMFESLSEADKKALMIIEKNETIKSFEIKKKESPIVDTQDGIKIGGNE